MGKVHCYSLRQPPPDDDAHAPSAAREPAARRPPLVYYAPDEIELPCCTAVWRDSRWQHEHSCPARKIALQP